MKSDFSVCTTWGVKKGRFYLLHVLRKRLDYPNLKRAVREQWETFKSNVILIEDKASGTQLIQELVEERIHAVTRYKPEGDKLMRLRAQNRISLSLQSKPSAIELRISAMYSGSAVHPASMLVLLTSLLPLRQLRLTLRPIGSARWFTWMAALLATIPILKHYDF
jgi:hypothetical protein